MRVPRYQKTPAIIWLKYNGKGYDKRQRGRIVRKCIKGCLKHQINI